MLDAATRKPVAAVRHAGAVKWFNPDLGYGFITPAERIEEMDKPDIFVHLRALGSTNLARVVSGAAVSFVVGEHRGRLTAVEVRLE